jgi:ribosomal protein L37AE/L43A
MTDTDIEVMIDRAIALMRHRPSCPRCRSSDAWLFDNRRPMPVWCCVDCNRFFMSRPAEWTVQ